MIKDINLIESINCFLRPMGLSLSSQKQIIAKVTTVALAAILITSSLPSVSADCIESCLRRCPRGPQGPFGGPFPAEKKCANACFDRCYRSG